MILSAKDILIILLRGIGLFLLQIGVLQHLHINGFGTPMVFPLFIMLLPINMKPLVLLIVALAYGYFFDMFTNGSGIQFGSLVAMAYARKYILILLRPLLGYDKEAIPNINYLGAVWFAKYLFLCLLVHQCVYYFLDSMSLQNFFHTLWRSLCGTLFSFIIVWVVNLLFVTKQKRR